MTISPANARSITPQRLVVWAAATIFFLATTTVSWLRWANFHYRTFDLAYYVQAVWQLIHGRFAATVENVPLLGNHVEPIIFLFAPIFALIRHPMVFIVIQNAALATMGPVGYNLVRRLGFDRIPAIGLAAAILLTPAAGYIALHEFHPEALAAPLLLLMFYSRTVDRLWLHWLCFCGTLACKENMALLLGAYCIVFLIIERRRGRTELIRWYGGPLALAIVWFILCAKLITPAFNSGNIDYLSLYDRLGKNTGEIVWNTFTKPRLVADALLHALAHGNLVWGLLIPFLGLPLLRPRWLLLAGPILLQHLLSWRSSEWTIYFHYAAPLLPVFWIATVEALAWLRDRRHAISLVTGAASLVMITCLTAQLWIGPARAMRSELWHQGSYRADRIRKEDFIRKIPAQASLTAPLPYLSHLAMREKLFSLHYILKGLRTLSREPYQPPPPTDLVLIDYDDSVTLDAFAGYYHPQMRTTDDRIIPSSDWLLHDFLSKTRWTVESEGGLTLFRKVAANEYQHQYSTTDKSAEGAPGGSNVLIATGNELTNIRRIESETANTGAVELELHWNVDGARKVFPWMILRLAIPGQSGAKSLTKGLCAVEVDNGNVVEHWKTTVSDLPAGDYGVEVIFVDNAKRRWIDAHGHGDLQLTALGTPISVGSIKIGKASP